MTATMSDAQPTPTPRLAIPKTMAWMRSRAAIRPRRPAAAIQMPACTALLIAAVTSARARRISFLTRSARSAKRSLSPFRSAESVSDSPAIGSISAALAGRHGGVGGENLVTQLVLALPLVQLVVPIFELVVAVVILIPGGVE